MKTAESLVFAAALSILTLMSNKYFDQQECIKRDGIMSEGICLLPVVSSGTISEIRENQNARSVSLNKQRALIERSKEFY